MEDPKTLHQIKQELGLSRKVIQGYERHLLLRSCGKDRYGRLLYDEKTLHKIIRIRSFQKLGFTLKQIEGFIDQPLKDIRPLLQERMIEIEEQIKQLSHLHVLMERLLEQDGLNEETIMKIVKEER